MDDYDSDDNEAQGAAYVRLIQLRAQNRMAAAKAKESEARALAQKSGSLTEELRREQKTRRRAVEKAKKAEIAATEAQQACQELQYTNKKLQQELASAQVAAKLAADRSNRCMRNLRDTLFKVEVDASTKFTRGQQEVQQLIALTKRLQSLVSSSTTSSSPSRHQLQHQQQAISSTSAHQVLSHVFRTLASLGELLTPSPSLLQTADNDDATALSPTAGHTAHEAVNATTLQSTVPSGRSCSHMQRPATAGPVNSSGAEQQDARWLASRCCLLQAQLDDAARDKSALQRRCDDLALQLQQHVGHIAAAASDNRLDTLHQLAEVTGLQAEKLQLQQEVEALQASSAAAQSALHVLREDHAQQTSRLAAANAEVLRLRAEVSHLEIALSQQQQDVASALSIVAGREVPSRLALFAPQEGHVSAQHINRLTQQHQQCMRWGQDEAAGQTQSAAAAGRLHVNNGSPSGSSPAHRTTVSSCKAQQSLFAEAGRPTAQACAAVTSHTAGVRPSSALLSNMNNVTHQVSVAQAGRPASAEAAAAAARMPHQPQHTSHGENSQWQCGGRSHALQRSTAEHALQQHRQQTSFRDIASPRRFSSNICNGPGAAAAAGSGFDRQSASPAERYSALIADADAALQRIAECRKAVVRTNANNSDSRPKAATGCNTAGDYCVHSSRLHSTGLATVTAGSASYCLSGREPSSRTEAAQLLDAAAAAAWTAPATNACAASRCQEAMGSAQLQAKMGIHVPQDACDSSTLRLNELRAELHSMDEDIEAAEAALHAATARFSSKLE